LSLELFYGGQAAPNGHLIETVEKLQRSFLIFWRKLMRVIAFHHSDSIAMIEALVERSHFSHGLARAFDREKIQDRCGHEHRPWIHQQEQAGMIESARDHSEQILFRIAIRVGKNEVVHPHGQSRDVAGRRKYFDTWIHS